MPVSIFAIIAIGPIAGVVAFFAVVRRRERSLRAFLAIVGLLLAIRIAGASSYPH